MAIERWISGTRGWIFHCTVFFVLLTVMMGMPDVGLGMYFCKEFFLGI